MTFAVMLLSGMGQPALLYLVPFTLITSAAVAGYRKEMKQFWTGTTYEVKAPKHFPEHFPVLLLNRSQFYAHSVYSTSIITTWILAANND